MIADSDMCWNRTTINKREGCQGSSGMAKVLALFLLSISVFASKGCALPEKEPRINNETELFSCGISA